MGPTDGTLIGLHPHNLRTPDAQAHVSARKHNSILRVCIAHHTLLLCIISQVGSRVVYAVNIIHVEDVVIVQQFLLEILERKLTDIATKCPVGKLNRLLCSSSIVIGINCFDTDNDGVVVILILEKVFSFKLRCVYHADLRWECLVETFAEFIGLGSWVLVTRVETGYQNRKVTREECLKHFCTRLNTGRL